MGYEERHTNPAGGKRPRPAWQLILLDLALTGLVLCVFALFHHVLPSVQRRLNGPMTPIATVTPLAPPVETAAAEASPEVTPDPNDWRAKFAGRFTEETVVTENSYTSPNLSVEISTHVVTMDNGQPTTYYVADIYLADISGFRTCFSNPRYHESGESLAQQYGAILAINGDYATNQSYGLLVRNGQIYMEEQTENDICVLYYDGSMETYGPLIDLIFPRYGLELLESDGSPKTEFNTTYAIVSRNPRTGLGYYEPGHYCFVVLDGRQEGYSYGMPMEGFAKIFSDLGCAAAYNMDGGDSAVMVFNGAEYNRPSHGGRNLGDMLYIAEPDTPFEGEGE